MTDAESADLIKLVDDLEARANGYLTLPEVETACGPEVDDAISAGILVVDHRTRLDRTAQMTSVTLCRLNRQHPLVKQLTAW